MGDNYLGKGGNPFQVSFVTPDDEDVKTVLDNIDKLESVHYNDLTRDCFIPLKEELINYLNLNWDDYHKSIYFQKALRNEGSTISSKDLLNDLEGNFDLVIEIDELYQEFLDFLRNKLASENLEFWKDVDTFKKVGNISNALELSKVWLGYPGGEGVICLENNFYIDTVFSKLNAKKLDLNIFDELLNECKRLLKTHWVDFCSHRSHIKTKKTTLKRRRTSTIKGNNSLSEIGSLPKKEKDLKLYPNQKIN